MQFSNVVAKKSMHFNKEKGKTNELSSKIFS